MTSIGFQSPEFPTRGVRLGKPHHQLFLNENFFDVALSLSLRLSHSQKDGLVLQTRMYVASLGYEQPAFAEQGLWPTRIEHGIYGPVFSEPYPPDSRTFVREFRLLSPSGKRIIRFL